MQIVINIPDEKVNKYGNDVLEMSLTFVDRKITQADGYTFYQLPKRYTRLIEAPPTVKQIEYAKYLAQRMCQELPKEFTKQAYSEFISKWKPAAIEEDKAMNEPDAWQMQYM